MDAKLSNELVRFTVEASWHHFHGIIGAILDAASFDLQSVLATLDILKHSISASIFLDMEMERRAFATQLARIKFIKEQEGESTGKDASFYILSGEHKKEKWFKDMEVACETGREVETCVGNIHMLIVELRASMHDSRKRRELKAVSMRIQGGSELLNDANREFLLEGDLLKRCRSGKKVKYRFFLFSDRLIYTHLSMYGYFKIHEQLLLSMMRVNYDLGKRNTFQILHPRKSFVVICPNPETKKKWVGAILSEIEKCVERKIKAEELRHAYADPLEVIEYVDGTRSSSRGTSEQGSGEWAELSQGVVVDNNGLGNPTNHDEGIEVTVGYSNAESLNEAFHKALHFSTDLLTGAGDTASVAEASVKFELYGYFKQAKEGSYKGSQKGDAAEEGSSSPPEGDLDLDELKERAWRRNRGMKRSEAKLKYIALLNNACPGWQGREEGSPAKSLHSM